MSEPVAIVTAISDDHSFAAGVAFLSMASTCTECELHFKVFHTGLSAANKNALTSLFRHIDFFEFSAETIARSICEALGNKISLNRAIKIAGNRPIFFLIKLEAIRFLEHYETVVFTDVDTLYLDSVAGAFSLPGVSGRNAAKNLRDKIGKIPVLEKVNSDLPNNYPTPNAGFICLHAIGDWRAMIRESYRVLTSYEPEFALGVDEAIFAWSAWRLGYQLHSLPSAYNYSAYHAKSAAKMVHSLGSRKFWNDNILKSCFPEWSRYYERWLDSGGSPYGGRVWHPGFSDVARGVVAQKMRYAVEWAHLYSQIGDAIPAALMPSHNTIESYSKIFIRSMPRNIHFELQYPDFNRYSLHFFWKSRHCPPELASAIDKALAQIGMTKVSRNDVFEAVLGHCSAIDIPAKLAKAHMLLSHGLYDRLRATIPTS